MAEWIEIFGKPQQIQAKWVSASDGGVDWNGSLFSAHGLEVVSASDGGVDWNTMPVACRPDLTSLR